MSHACLAHHVNRMIKLGWVKMHSGNLCFVSLDKIGITKRKDGVESVNNYISIKVCKTKKEQILLFRHAIIWRNVDRQKRAIKKRSDVVKLCKSNKKVAAYHLKQIARKGGLDEYEKTIVNYTTLSNTTFGLLINRSRSTGQILQKQLRDKKLIQTRFRHKVIKANATKQAFAYFMNDNLIRGVKYRDGNIYQQLSNEVEIVKPLKRMQCKDVA